MTGPEDGMSDEWAAVALAEAIADLREPVPAAWLLRPAGGWMLKGGLTTLIGYDPAEEADERGRRPSEVNAGTVLNPTLARVLCEAYNARVSGLNSRRRARQECAAQLRALATDADMDHTGGAVIEVPAAALLVLANRWDPPRG